MKILDKVTGFLGLQVVKVAVIAFAAGVVIGFGVGWFEKGLRVAASDLNAQTKAVEVHGKQEDESLKAGKEAEHGKQKAKAAMGAVPPAIVRGPVGVFDADGVREQTDLIAAGESAINRRD